MHIFIKYLFKTGSTDNYILIIWFAYAVV